jgi:hypothetical protein
MPTLNRFSAMNQPCKCTGCGKPTHSAIRGVIGPQLCGECLDDAGAENEHNDCHDSANPEPGCRFCVKA